MTDQNREETPDVVAQVRAALESVQPFQRHRAAGCTRGICRVAEPTDDVLILHPECNRALRPTKQDQIIVAAAPQLLAMIDDLRKSKSALHRRAQAAEGALLKAQRQQPDVDTWSSVERQQEAKERDRMMDAVGKAESR